MMESIKAAMGGGPSAGGPSNDLNDIDIEMPPAGAEGDQSPFMKDYFENVEQVKRNMEQIKKNVKQIETKHGSVLSAVSTVSSNKRQEELEDLMDQTSTLINAVKEKLKDMDKEGKEQAKKAGRGGEAETRIRANMHQTLTKKFVSYVKEYQEMQTKYKAKYRERVGRQLKVVKPDATDDDIDKIMEEGGEQSVFSQQILQGRSTQAARNALADIQDKHKDILRLEQSIVELHQLFVDMSVLVESQGEMLDQIEYSVQQAHAMVEKGVVQLEKAKESQKKSRKRMCTIMVCLIIVLVIVMGIVFGSLMSAKII